MEPSISAAFYLPRGSKVEDRDWELPTMHFAPGEGVIQFPPVTSLSWWLGYEGHSPLHTAVVRGFGLKSGGSVQFKQGDTVGGLVLFRDDALIFTPEAELKYIFATPRGGYYMEFEAVGQGLFFRLSEAKISEAFAWLQSQKKRRNSNGRET